MNQIIVCHYKTTFMKPKLKFIFVSLLSFLTIAQDLSSQPKKERKKNAGAEERYNPNFSYSPATRDSVASTGITIALLTPIFIDKDIDAFGNPFSDFSKALTSDVEELLISKGFKVRGPFNSIDEMVTPDKFNSDFIIRIGIDMSPKVQRTWKNVLSLLSSSGLYRVGKGDVSINAKVQLTAMACFTAEKLWKKDLDVVQKNFNYSGSVNWPSNNVAPMAELQQEVNLWNPFCKKMEEVYKESLDILYKQFDKDEMTSVANESRKTDKERRGN
jgi:hypothetical protein